MAKMKLLNIQNFLKEQRCEEFVDIAKMWFGMPYIYGGNSIAGVDCSGFVCNVLRSIGRIGQKDDYSVNGLWKKLSKPDNVYDQAEPGRIAFWFNNKNEAIHIAICTSYVTTIQAARGDSSLYLKKDHTPEELQEVICRANKMNAMVDFVPVNYRLDNELRFIDIFNQDV